MRASRKRKPFRIRLIIALVVAGIAGGLYWYSRYRPSPFASCPGCNVVIISIDSLRADALPCYGYALPTAPNLCTFASKSALFTNMYANATWTRPSNMSILSSLYPVGHGMVDPVLNVLNPDVTTLPQMLASRGYVTRFVANDQIHISIELGYKRIFQKVRLTPATLEQETEAAWLATIDKIKKDNAAFHPSFVFFHTDHVHDYVDRIPNPPSSFPLDPSYKPPAFPHLLDFTEETWQYMKQYFSGSMHAYRVQSTVDEFDAALKKLERATTLDQAGEVFLSLPEDWQNDIQRNMAERRLNARYFSLAVPLYRHLYDDSIRTLDQRLGKVFKRIEENGLADNTIVIVTGDHGQVLGEFKLLGHIVTLAKQEISVPLIIRVPRIAPQVRNELTQHIDILPTVLELVGIPVHREAQGISLAGLMQNKPNAPRNAFVISQTTMPSVMNTIITDRWRLMEARYPSGTYRELFDRLRDPKETVSVAPQHQDIVEELGNLMYTTLSRQKQHIPVESTLPEWKTETDRQNAVDRTE